MRPRLQTPVIGREQGRHIRPDLARSVVNAQWNLCELSSVGLSLESIFLQLTGGESAGQPSHIRSDDRIRSGAGDAERNAGAAASSAALPTTGTWSVDPIHSTARFAITHHAIATFRAGFDSISGTFDAERGVLSGTVPVENIDLQGVAKFKADLLAERFFDGQNHPNLSFVSAELNPDTDGTVRLEGDLTIKGSMRRGEVSSIDSIDPKPRCCLCASSCCGCVGSPG